MSNSDTDIVLNGPPEPIVTDTGTKFIIPTGEPSNPVKEIEFGTWECQRCNHTTKPITEPPDQCQSCERKGVWQHAGGIDEPHVRAANRGVEMWEPPSDITDEHYDKLWDDLTDFIRAHWDTSDEWLYDGLAAYAITTWLRKNLTFIPHAMLRGKTLGGKTRLLNTLKEVSYRGIVTASATPSSMFRLIDGYNVTYYISEYHGLEKEARRELDNIVRAGQKRGEVVTRSEQITRGFEPKVYDPFTHVAIATQYEPDDDIINRCIQIQSQSADRDMPPVIDSKTGQSLRNRLLYTRFRLLEPDDPNENTEWQQAETKAYDYLNEKGIEGRTREKLLSMVTVAFLWDKHAEIRPVVGAVVDQDREAAADSEDALVVEAIRDLGFDALERQNTLSDGNPWEGLRIPYADILDQYEEITGYEKSPTWLGHVRSRLNLGKERKRNGTLIKDPELGAKLKSLCDEMNLEWDSDDREDLDVEIIDETADGPPADAIDRKADAERIADMLREKGCEVGSDKAMAPAKIAGALMWPPERTEKALKYGLSKLGNLARDSQDGIRAVN